MLSFSDKARDVLDARGVFILEAEALALKSGFVYQHSRVCLKSRKRDRKMLIYLLDFADSAYVLKLGNGALLYSQHNDIFTRNSNGCAASVNSFEGILNLKELAVWCEDGDRFVVLCHKNY